MDRAIVVKFFALLALVVFFAAIAFLLLKKAEKEKQTHENFGDDFESLVKQIEGFEASSLRKSHMRFRVLKRARDKENKANFYLRVSYGLQGLNLVVNSLIPPITVAKLTVALVVPWLETETITALLASIGLTALGFNTLLNLEGKAEAYRETAKNLTAELWSSTSLVGVYHGLEPDMAAGMCLVRCEEAISLEKISEPEPPQEQKKEDQNTGE